MASRAEQIVSRSLRAILSDLADGASIAEGEQFREFLTGLEYFVPEVLSEVYPEWRKESLDGFYPLVAKKTRERGRDFWPLHPYFRSDTSTDSPPASNIPRCG
jgi:hypothetical protein